MTGRDSRLVASPHPPCTRATPPGRPERRANGKRPRPLGAARARQRRRVALRWRSRTSVRPRPATRGRRKATRPSRQRPASDARNKNQNSKKKKQNILRPGPPGCLSQRTYPVPRRKKKERERRPATTRPGPRVACPALAWLAIRLFLRPSFLHVPITRCHLGAEHTCPRIKLPMMIILDVSSTASVFIYLCINQSA